MEQRRRNRRQLPRLLMLLLLRLLRLCQLQHPLRQPRRLLLRLRRRQLHWREHPLQRLRHSQKKTRTVRTRFSSSHWCAAILLSPLVSLVHRLMLFLLCNLPLSRTPSATFSSSASRATTEFAVCHCWDRQCRQAVEGLPWLLSDVQTTHGASLLQHLSGDRFCGSIARSRCVIATVFAYKQSMIWPCVAGMGPNREKCFMRTR